jgi:type IV secretion system protein VirB9
MKPVLLAVALAAVASAAAAGDPRIRAIEYAEDQVTPLQLAQGYAAVVEVAPDETIDSVVVGNSSVWQITETSSGNRVVVKPLSGAVPTNMVILTERRRYVFLLEPVSGGDQSSFVISFNSGPEALQHASASAATYKLHGDSALFPTAMYDDGRRTTIRWANQTPLPAIYSIKGDQEALVNGRMIGRDYVIEGTADRYKLKYGASEAIAVRKIARPPR